MDRSLGHAKRNSHFEFGSPDPNANDFQKNEIPYHGKAGMQDHNRSREDYYEESLSESRKQNHSGSSQNDFRGPPSQDVPHNSGRRGPPSASYDHLSGQESEHNVHGREYNMGRRAPPQSQYDFLGTDAEQNSMGSQNPSGNAGQSSSTGREQAENIHGREYNMSRRPPPQSQYDFMSGSNEAVSKPESRAASHNYSQQSGASGRDEPENIHGREYNMSRRPPPQKQYDFLSGGEEIANKPESRAASHQFAQSSVNGREEPENIHGREYNMSRRPPPQSQYDFMSGADEAAPKPQSRAASHQFAQSSATGREEPENVHGREYNMSRRAPPQAQYDFMGDSEVATEQEHSGRASSRRFTPTEETSNIHGREYNMSRRAPPQAQYDFMGSSEDAAPVPQRQSSSSRQQAEEGNIHGREYNMSRRGPPAPQHDFFGN